MFKAEKICRLCLRASESDSAIIDDVAKGILDALSLKLDLSLSKEPIMCKNCETNLQKSFDFLLIVQNTRNGTFPLTVNENFNMRDDSSNRRQNVDVTDNISHGSCHFCLQIVCEGYCIPLSHLKEDFEALMDVLPKCIFDLCKTATEEAALCEYCNDAIQNHIFYIKSCLEIERKVKTYCKIEEIDSKDQIDLADIFPFNLTQNEANDTDLNLVKQEDNVYWNEHDITTEVQIKNEDLTEAADLHLKVEPIIIDKMPGSSNAGSTHDDKSCTTERCKRKTSQAVYKCHNCPFETTTKRYLHRHSHIHKGVEIYKCDVCPYETNVKFYLKKHAGVHKDTSEVRMYKCDACPFQTRHHWYLNTHVLRHKDASETTIYSCEVCPYKTKVQKFLRRHLLNHNDSLQYKCEYCPYVTKHKECLKRHVINHKNSSEITEYKCELCTYTTRHKANLTLHVVLHKDASEVTLYQCETCSYKSKTRHNLRQHLLVHKSDSEVRIYKCKLCTYETKRGANLKQHVVVHKKSSEAEIFRCDHCSYETRWKGSLKQHVLIHKNFSELTLYKCGSCSYASKLKGGLKRHMQTCKQNEVE